MLFGKKQETTNDKVPIQEVMELRQKGLPNEDLITYLKKKGYSISQIRDAITQVDIKTTAAGMGGAAQEPPTPPNVPDIQEELESGAPRIEEDTTPPESNYESVKPLIIQNEKGVPGADINKIERILEQMISERWAEVEKKYMELERWKSDFNSKISTIEVRMEELTKRVENVDNMLLGKLNEYDKSMEDVGTSIQSLEKVMKNIVPSLSESMKELRSAADKKKKK